MIPAKPKGIIMGINLDKPHLWKKDIAESVDFYNAWFMRFAPKAFRESRITTAQSVEEVLLITSYLSDISPEVLIQSPGILPILRMTTCPPLARDRLVGLAHVPRSLVINMENPKHPKVSSRISKSKLEHELCKISQIITKMADPDICTWLSKGRNPDELELLRASTVIADRLCGALADPIIRNAQEKRQLTAIRQFLEARGYTLAAAGTRYNEMENGTFAFHCNIPVFVSDSFEKKVNIPVDVAIKTFRKSKSDMPLLIEAKSAGDFANVNKRRKEEGIKMQQLRKTYGNEISYTLFLCGYFDSGYLGYEAAEGIDWIWEHRIDDLMKLGI